MCHIQHSSRSRREFQSDRDFHLPSHRLKWDYWVFHRSRRALSWPTTVDYLIRTAPWRRRRRRLLISFDSKHQTRDFLFSRLARCLFLCSICVDLATIETLTVNSCSICSLVKRENKQHQQKQHHLQICNYWILKNQCPNLPTLKNHHGITISLLNYRNKTYFFILKLVYDFIY